MHKIFGDAPELRHIVDLGVDASGNKVELLFLPEGVDTLKDIQDDPDYNALGWVMKMQVCCTLNQFLISLSIIKTLFETEKAKTASLETQVASLLERVSALET